MVDIQAAAKQGIPVSNVPGYSTDAVAQHAFALLLELCRRPALHDAAVRRGQWQRSDEFSFHLTPQVELSGLVMGIIGFGRIGRRVGEIAHAMGMQVLAATRTRKNPPDYRPFAWAGIPELLGTADVISLHCPLTEETRGMINRESLAEVRPGAFLINTARGPLVDESALAEALNQGRLAGAGLDVFEKEPLPLDSPLLKAENCIVTPHLAWATLAARVRLMRQTAQNIRAFVKGTPVNVVNKA